MREYDWHNPEPNRFCSVAAVIAGGTAIYGAMSQSEAMGDAAGRSADASMQAAGMQQQSSRDQIAEYRRQFDTFRELLSPYVDTGTKALSGYNDLLGTNGDVSQFNAIEALKRSPAFTSLQKTGQNAILANASATGGLRGGNVETSLAQYDEGLLSNLITQRLGALGGLVSMGQNAAAGVGNAGLNTGGMVGGALGTIGQAGAGGALGAATAANVNAAGQANIAGNLAGTIKGLIPSNFSLFGNSGVTPYNVTNPAGTADPSGLYYPE